MARIQELHSWLLPPHSEHVFALNSTEMKFSFPICLVCPSLGVKEYSLVGECLKSRAVYNQWLGNSLGNQHTHTYILDSLLLLFPQKYRPERLFFQNFISSPRLKTDSTLSSKKRSKISPFSDSHSVASWASDPPQGSLHLNCRHWDPEPNNIQIPARRHPQILLLHITQLRPKYYLQMFPHFSFLF